MNTNTLRHVPMALLGIFTTKLLIVGTNLQEMGVVVALATLTAGYEYFSRLKQVESIADRLKEYDTVIAEQNKVIARMAEEVGTLRSKVTVSTGMKRVGS